MKPSGIETRVVAAEPTAGTSESPPVTRISKEELTKILERHRKWIESNGTEGERADLSLAHLEGFDLTGANLRGAHLYRTNLKGADLFMTELHGACLARANLQETNLLGTQLCEANLQGANLESATGLLAGQLAGTDLLGAVLPPLLSDPERLRDIHRQFKKTIGISIAMLGVCALAWWRIVTTTDLQILKRSSALPFDRIGNVLPMTEFYLVAPLALLGFYIFFHCYLQHLWEALAGLPAIFPDGRRLEKNGPWLVLGLASRQIEWLGKNGSPLALLGAGVSALFAYWVVPITLILFWARYLTRQDLHGTMLQVLLVVCAMAFATVMPRLFPRRPRLDHPQPQPLKRLFATRELYIRGTIVLAVGVLLSLLSFGTILGVPYDGGRGSAPSAMGVRTWAAHAFRLVGYNPYADLAESDTSSKPANLAGREDELSLVKGAQLNKVSLRHAEAYRSSWINAHLWKVDFQNANLSEADLRGANLRQAVLRSAVLDRAKLDRANLEEADLSRANLARASLREANLAFALLAETILIDARLDGANLYGADLRTVRLLRASLAKADLREVNLENGRLSYADLREAYLSSARLLGVDLRESQLERALLIDADLRRADLRGANLQEAKLRGADLGGANLDGADLRGALGLTASQICSVASRRELKLDESLQHQVDTQCGGIR